MTSKLPTCFLVWYPDCCNLIANPRVCELGVKAVKSAVDCSTEIGAIQLRAKNLGFDFAVLHYLGPSHRSLSSPYPKSPLGLKQGFLGGLFFCVRN